MFMEIMIMKIEMGSHQSSKAEAMPESTAH
jgi:hypothetical protein